MGGKVCKGVGEEGEEYGREGESTHGEVDIIFGEVLAFVGDRAGDRGGGVEAAEFVIATSPV